MVNLVTLFVAVSISSISIFFENIKQYTEIRKIILHCHVDENEENPERRSGGSSDQKLDLEEFSIPDLPHAFNGFCFLTDLSVDGMIYPCYTGRLPEVPTPPPEFY